MMTLQHQTKIAIYIAVDNGPDNLNALIAALTTLVQLLVSFCQFITSAVTLAYDIVEAVSFTAKVWAVWFNAFNYGLFGAGVKCKCMV